MKKSILIPIFILALVTLACGFGDVTEMISGADPTAAPTDPPPLVDPTDAPQQIPTAEPTATREAPPPTQPPTEPPPPTAEPSGPMYFREEFDGNVNWSFEYIYGNTQDQCEDPGLFDGQLRWSCRPGEETQIRFYEDIHRYEDVVVQVEVENYASNTNWTALMCRVNDKGWIEFRFTTAGLFEIYRFDQGRYAQDENPYVYIGNGATPHMKPGQTTNEVAMVCAGEEFEFYANGKQIDITIPPKYREEYTRQDAGGVGVGFQVMADNGGPVDVGIEWFETFEP